VLRKREVVQPRGDGLRGFCVGRHDARVLEHAHRVHGAEDQRDQQQRPHQRQRDVSKLEPIGGLIHFGSLVQIARHRGQTRQRDQQHERSPLPDIDDGQRDQRNFLIGQPFHRREAKRLDVVVQRSPLRLVHLFPE